MKIIFATLALLTGLSSHASSIAGNYGADHELFKGQQAYAIELTITSDLQYTLQIDPNKCSFGEWGFGACTEIAMPLSTGRLTVIEEHTSGAKRYALSADPSVQIVSLPGQNLQELRYVQRDAQNNVITVRRLVAR